MNTGRSGVCRRQGRTIDRLLASFHLQGPSEPSGLLQGAASNSGHGFEELLTEILHLPLLTTVLKRRYFGDEFAENSEEEEEEQEREKG